MKSLGGVGAVVLGAMLLLTVKVGPARSQPDPSSSENNGPTAAVAAVPDAPPRSTPAAAAPVIQDLQASKGRVRILRKLTVRQGTIEVPSLEQCDLDLELRLPASRL